ncbi:hypothetical protein CR513_31147, partial [Mucuna pruriens]
MNVFHDMKILAWNICGVVNGKGKSRRHIALLHLQNNFGSLWKKEKVAIQILGCSALLKRVILKRLERKLQNEHNDVLLQEEFMWYKKS